MSARILVLPGTLESRSPNHALAFEAARRLALTSATVTTLGLADYPLPLLDADAETGEPPAEAVRLAERIAGEDALLLVSPDANGCLPPLAKNAIDWASRVSRAKGRPLDPFRGLVVGLASASPGRLGGFKALDAWRVVFMSLGAEVMTRQATLAGGSQTFDERGRIRDAQGAARLEAFVDDLVSRALALGRHHP